MRRLRFRRRAKMRLGAIGIVLLFCVGLGFGVRSVWHHQAIPGAAIQASTNDARIAFLATFGWTVETEPDEVIKVLIPAEFDDTYAAYNKLQKQQGFDLSKYKGKTVKRWTYAVTNYPARAENIYANILIYQNKIIGGDIYSTELDGFMHGFELKN